MKHILAFNINDEIKKIFSVLNIEIIDVSKEEQAQTLEYLITKDPLLKGNLPKIQGFAEPLLVFHDFDEDSFDRVLMILKENDSVNILKAIVTPVNIHWPAILLYSELVKERREFNRRH